MGYFIWLLFLFFNNFFILFGLFFGFLRGFLCWMMFMGPTFLKVPHLADTLSRIHLELIDHHCFHPFLRKYFLHAPQQNLLVDSMNTRQAYRIWPERSGKRNITHTTHIDNSIYEHKFCLQISDNCMFVCV